MPCTSDCLVSEPQAAREEYSVRLAIKEGKSLSGTIYAPGALVTITGNDVTTGCTADGDSNTDCAAIQIISDTWKMAGGIDLEMPYDPSLLYQLPLKGLVR